MTNRFSKSKEQLEKLNESIRNDATLSSVFIDGPYEYLQWYQASLFGDFMEHRGSSIKTSLPATNVFVRAFFILFISFSAWFRMILTRHKIAVFGIDRTSSPKGRDFRMEGIYAWLDKANISYIDFLHTTIDGGLFRRFKKRGRLVWYQESLDILWAFIRRFRKNPYQDIQDPVIKKLYVWKRRSDFRIHAYRFLLRRSSIRAVLSIDDVRHYNELMAVCAELGIDFHAFQHGNITKYHAGWKNILGRPLRAQPLRYHVWSSYWKNEFKRLGGCYEDERVVVSGNPKGGVKAMTPWNPPEGSIGILFGYEVAAPLKEVQVYLNKMRRMNGVKIFFGLRPDIPEARQREEYGLNQSEGVEIVKNLDDVIEDIHIAVGTHSTLLYDVIAKGKLSVILETSLDYASGMLDNELADQLHKDEDIRIFLNRIIKKAPEVIPERQKKLFEGEGNLARALKHITEPFAQE